jgi:hypothetical protein
LEENLIILVVFRGKKLIKLISLKSNLEKPLNFH